MSRHRTGSKKAPPEIGLFMECTEEDLEPCQIVHYNKAETEYNEIQNKLDMYINKMKAEVIEKGENCLVLQLNVSTPSGIASTPQAAVTSGGKVTRQSASQNYQQVVSQGILTRSASNTSGSTYLVMDPRLGLVVGQVPPTTVTTDATPSPAKSTPGTRARSTPGTVMVTTRARSGVKKTAVNTVEAETLAATPATRGRDKGKTQAQAQQTTSPPATQVIQQVYSPGSSSSAPGSYRIKVNAKPLSPPAKPSENTALGGLTAGSKTPWKPSSDEGGKGNAADSREVTFNKMSGKTFPSLVVAARPHLRLKYIPQSNITQERTGLDAKVKGVLMYTASKFTEWLIQQGIIKSEQTCPFHVNNDLSPVKLKLGMYSDVLKFPYSGGYVWISECCPSQFVSVFSGSIFEGAPHPPTTLLKLIYHWACQTNVQNVVQWVKVDNLYVKNFFTNMRAVCTQAIHQKHQKMGGPRAKIEVGVISLGTTSQDGNLRQVKVEVLGVMDPESKLIRLRALEPLSEEKNFKRRFIKILEPLEEWVHKESTIFTDFTVDKGTLINMGFRTVYQTSASDPPTKYSNQNVMEYLRKIVPRMFQNTLSLLSRQIIQQFLDELIWREMWGPIPSQAFVNIIAHIAEQTKLDVAENLLFRLNKVASNPFKNWNYSVWKPVTISLSNTKALPPPADLDTVPLVARLASLEDTGPSILKNSRSRKRTTDPDFVATSTPIKKAPKVAVKEKATAKKSEAEKVKVSDGKTPKKEKDASVEVEKVIAEDALAFIKKDGPQIPLDSYYYGTRQGDEEAVAFEYKGAFNVKCSVCYVPFKENISIMKHMVLHSQLDPALTVSLKDVQQCNYCFLGFNTNDELKDHLIEMHPTVHNRQNGMIDCQICEEKFGDRVELIYHMHRTHIEMEMPYECGVCLFRTSVYKLLIDHFMQIHKGGECVMCPHCLKVVKFAEKGDCIEMNVRFFEMHLERHTRTSLTKKCHRCKLSFINVGIFEQHMEADHCGFKNELDVKPFAHGPDTITMPEPGTVIKPVTPPKTPKVQRAKPAYMTNKFKALEVSGLDDGMTCLECEGSLVNVDHFSGNFICVKCRFATCCEKAVAEHVTIFHDSASPQFSVGKPIVLPEGMFCVCGFSTYSGNRLAKHIAVCDRKSAYPTEEAANAAIVPTGGSQSKTLQPNGDSQNMLNMLGLMRKSPEVGGCGLSDESLKKEEVSEVVEEEIGKKGGGSDGSCDGDKEVVVEDKKMSVCKDSTTECAMEGVDASQGEEGKKTEPKESKTTAAGFDARPADEPDKDIKREDVAKEEKSLDVGQESMKNDVEDKSADNVPSTIDGEAVKVTSTTESNVAEEEKMDVDVKSEEEGTDNKMGQDVQEPTVEAKTEVSFVDDGAGDEKMDVSEAKKTEDVKMDYEDGGDTKDVDTATVTAEETTESTTNRVSSSENAESHVQVL